MKYLYLFLLLTFGLSGCVKNNPAPIWLEINSWTLNANPNPSTQPNSDPGVLSHNFSDVWVYIDGKVIGVFEVPCKVPVLVSGTCKITLLPTIRNNGVAVTKKAYPFMQQFETTLNLVEGETYTINPTTYYASTTSFHIEDFESNSVTIQKDASVSSPNLEMQVENNSSIGPWGRYGHLALDGTNSLWIGVLPALALPKGGSPVYLEVDYRSTNSILTGMLEYQVGGAIIDHDGYSIARQTASDLKWKKIYIDLKDVVSNTPSGIAYKQYLKMQLDNDLSSSDVYIDNIKVVF